MTVKLVAFFFFDKGGDLFMQACVQISLRVTRYDLRVRQSKHTCPPCCRYTSLPPPLDADSSRFPAAAGKDARRPPLQMRCHWFCVNPPGRSNLIRYQRWLNETSPGRERREWREEVKVWQVFFLSTNHLDLCCLLPLKTSETNFLQCV